jgi:uncharacterized protein YcbX
MIRVSRISISPVKGFRLLHPDRVELAPHGAAGNRRFFVVDGAGQRLRSSATPWLCTVIATHDADTEHLFMRFPDGAEVMGSALAGGETVHSTAGSLDVSGSIVEGPWTEPLSRLAGKPVRLARVAGESDGLTAPLTVVSDGSLRRFAAEAGRTDVDARRFRMLFELTGCEAHEEDEWDGRRFRVGDAEIRAGGPVDRCAVTTRDPETGARDLDALRILGRYRGRRESDGAVLFGVYGYVERPGTVRVGDVVEPLGA